MEQGKKKPKLLPKGYYDIRPIFANDRCVYGLRIEIVDREAGKQWSKRKNTK